jgi:hypothetical protein
MSYLPTTPVILKDEDDGAHIDITFIDGKNYHLQHPGNRARLRWERQFFSLSNGLDLERFLDTAFEHCVIPLGHSFKPEINSVKPKELEVWALMLRRFLDGNLQAAIAACGGSGGNTPNPVSDGKE